MLYVLAPAVQSASVSERAPIGSFSVDDDDPPHIGKAALDRRQARQVIAV